MKKTVRTGDIDTAYAVEGEGPWLVFSHSLACDASMWDGQAAAFRGRYRVLRYDTRGHGASGAPAGDYALAQLADDAKALLDALGIRSCHFVGLSMGGMIAQTFALKYPGVFRTITLADTTSRRHENARKMWDGRIAIAEAQGMTALVDSTLARWFTEPFRRAHPEVMEKIGASIRATPVAGYAGCARAIATLDLTHRLKEIAAPTLILSGEQDGGTPPDMARAMHAAKPGSELLIIPSASHLSNVEQPEIFNRALADFLARNS